MAVTQTSCCGAKAGGQKTNLRETSMTSRALCLTSVLALIAGTASAQEMSFNRVASFPTLANAGADQDRAAVTSAEIIAASGDGMTLVYTDSPLKVVGLIDITDPANPQPLGNIAMGGEPTAVSILGQTAFVAVNTSENYVNTSGVLRSIDIATRSEVAACDLGGQPDSTAMAPDGSFIAVAIENERDEDLGDGRVPQMPAGWVALIGLDNGVLDCDSMIRADVTGLADIGSEDPEPEFVDINAAGETIVTLQENNHIVILARDGSVTAHFSAGSVDLEGIDATDEQAALVFTESQPGRLREPDGIQWIDTTHFAMANEGDMDGGSRSWTIMSRDGAVVYESGTAFEHALVQVGHYPDRRSDAKGVEPEGMEFATFNGTPYVFVLSERGSAVGVFDVTDVTTPVLAQILPSGVSPEGVMAIPSRNLIVTANEADLVEDDAARAHVMIYEMTASAPVYPYLTSAGADSLIGWSALSGLAADPAMPGRLYAVNDSFFSYQPTIFTSDITQQPARITDAVVINRAGRPAQKIDIEGITADGEGGFWLASEGRSDRMIPHAILRVNASGRITQEIPFPAELLAHETRFASEGITMIGRTLWIAIQRSWGDDAANTVKLVAYDLDTKTWGAVSYETAAPTEGAWVGLSEITVQGDWAYLIERDNRIGSDAVTKLITRVPLADLVPAPLGGPLPVVTREVVRDLLPDLRSGGGYVVDKVEGLAFDAQGNAWVMTDNDGVDDSSGETMLLNLGQL